LTLGSTPAEHFEHHQRSASQITKYELTNSTLYGANFVNFRAFSHQYNFRFAANYVTGSHAFKVGMQDMFARASSNV